MNSISSSMVLLTALFLAACDKPVTVNVPPPAPTPVTVPGPAGPPGATGATGATGNTGAMGSGPTTVIVVPPAASAPGN